VVAEAAAAVEAGAAAVVGDSCNRGLGRNVTDGRYASTGIVAEAVVPPVPRAEADSEAEPEAEAEAEAEPEPDAVMDSPL